MRTWKAGPPRQLRSEFCEGRSAQAEWPSHPDARLDVRNSLESATGQPGIPFRGSVNRNARLPSMLPLQATEVECRRAESFRWQQTAAVRSEEHTSELQSLMRNSYAVFCLNKKIHHLYRYHAKRING